MKRPGCAFLALIVTAACGQASQRPTSATPVTHPPAITGLRTYLAGSVSSSVEFVLSDPDGDAVTWTSSVTTAADCRCTAGSLRLASVDERPAGPAAAAMGTVPSGTRIRLFYYPGSDSGPNNVLVTLEAVDLSGLSARASIEVPNW